MLVFLSILWQVIDTSTSKMYNFRRGDLMEENLMKNNQNETAFAVNNDVWQSNPLVQANKDFDVIGMRIFLLGLRALNPHFSEKDRYFDSHFKEIFIPTNKLTELFGGNTWYLHDLEKTCDKMFHAKIKIRPKDGGFDLYNLFRKLKYVPNEGLYIWFEDHLRPYILDLADSGGYTKINAEYLFKLSSPYAIRILELILQYQNIKQFKEMMEIKRTMTIEEIRFSLNVPEGAYHKRINNFRKYVLDGPIREINERTPYIVRYETIKAGRNVVAFEFIADTYNVPNEDKRIYRRNDAIKLLLSLGFNEYSAREIFKKCSDIQDCFSRINRAQSLLDRQKNPVKNKLGFLRKAIEENWQISRKVEERQKEIENARLRSAETEPRTEKGLSAEEREIIERRSKSLKIGRKEMTYSIASAYIQAIRKDEHLDSVKRGLAEYNVTIEKFTEICEKRGL